MSDPASTKITRLSELPRDIPPPRDGWPALEAQLRESGARRDGGTAAGDALDALDARDAPDAPDAPDRSRGGSPSGSRALADAASRRSWRRAVWLGAIAAAVAAVGAGILVDRLILQAGHPDAHRQLSARQTPAATGPREGVGRAPAPHEELPASFVTDPRYLAERAALLASLDERLKTLPPQTRQHVLASLATIHQSMQQIQQALGREPANALLQELLIDTYQDEMRVLTAVQEAGTGSGES